jgi:hypothetical protein
MPQNIRDLARSHTVEAIKTLARGLKSKSPLVQIKAAEMLLNRAWGTPTQHIEAGPAGAFDGVTDDQLINAVYQRLVSSGVEPGIAQRLVGTETTPDSGTLQIESVPIRQGGLAEH